LDNLRKRILSGAIGIALMIFVVYNGEILLDLSLLLVSLIGIKEIYNALNRISLSPINWIGYLSCMLIYSSIFIDINLEMLMITFALILLLIYVLDSKVNFKDISSTYFAIIYVPLMLINISYLGNTKFIWLIFTIAFGTDTFAYIIGSTMGKHKLSPKLSPKKSVEGAIGGIIGSLLVTVIYSYYFEIGPIWILACLAIIASIFAQIGDLAASKLKREAGIKDYGNIIPGHGGILDRFDSIIFVAPIVFYFCKFFLI